jgi:flagellar protein FlaI
LRQRPEYLLVGEVRGPEAMVAFQAMATGHIVYATMHADSARSAVYRLENNPINIPRIVLQSLDVVAVQAQVRVAGRRVRRLTEVVELAGIDPTSRELFTQSPFRWEPNGDRFEFSGRSPVLEKIANRLNWTPAQLRAEWARRTRLIERLAARSDLTYDEIGRIVMNYYARPDAVAKEYDAELVGVKH